tara:strand:+ start:896 stop:1120 length:225 start_codon:yes stop_codon:yes gene_type:complete
MLARYKNKHNKMEWRSTALINVASLGLSLTQIDQTVKITAMGVGIVWTLIQIVNGINVFLDRRARINEKNTEND